MRIETECPGCGSTLAPVIAGVPVTPLHRNDCSVMAGRTVAALVRYRNHRGEESARWILPLEVRYGATEYHEEHQWLLEVFDFDKGAPRTFAMKDILDWK